MKINFQQGIISYPVSGNQQAFLAKTGVYVSLQTTNGRTDVNFAHGETNYQLTEAADVPNAWGPIPESTDAWLFWDIDLATAVRTFGFTLLQPQQGVSLPPSATQGQHFFHTTHKKMYLYDSGTWRVVLRVFAAKVNNSMFVPLGSGFATRPYAGSQVGITPVEVVTGRILVDDTATPVRRPDGRFFTTEDKFFTNGSPVTSIVLEANSLTATAQEYLSAYQVVYYSSFGKINLATYDHLQDQAIAMLMENLSPNETGGVITQGTVTNPDWNFTTVGAKLWVDNAGTLVEEDPHITDPLNYPVGKPAIGRVITPNTIFFDQGLGGTGDRGLPGPAGTVDVAAPTILGVAKLSLTAVDPDNPVVVGDNDPRLSDARTPVSHNQAATTITVTPYGNVSSANVQLAIQELDSEKIARGGDSMTGFLTLSGSPVNNLHAATKQYVDNKTLASLGDVTLISAAAGDTLSFNGTIWTNNKISIEDLDHVDVTTTPPTSGDYLSWDGSTWSPTTLSLEISDLEDVDTTSVLPSPGDVLIWDGDGWTPGQSDIPISSNHVVVGTGSSIAGDASFTYDSTTGTLLVQPTLRSSPGNITITSATNADPALAAGNINVTGGQSTGAGSGGSVNIIGGQSVNGAGGTITIRGGNNTASNGAGGSVVIESGTGDGTDGIINFVTTRGVQVNSSAGNSGQVLTSAGTSSPPTWANVVYTPSVVTLGDGPTITPDFSQSNLFQVTIQDNRLLANPTNAIVGHSGVITVIQGTGGSKLLTYGDSWKFSGGTEPELSTSEGAIDILAYYVLAANQIAVKIVPNIQ